MEDFLIRNSIPADLPEIERVYAHARAFMKETGNPHQWGDTSPAPELIEGDFRNGTGYVIEKNGHVAGVFACIPGKDPTYSFIEDGAWLNDEPYVTIHRIAGDGTVHGVLEAAVAYAGTLADNIRIDTHRDNAVMHHLLAKNGFTRCGIIYLLNGDPRTAYQKKLR